MANVTQGGGYTPPAPPRSSKHTVKTKPYPNESAPKAAPRKTTPKRVAGSTGFYTIRNGDTLGSIAARYGTSVSALAALNGITNPNVIYAGQRIRVTGHASSSGGSTSHASSGSSHASSGGGGGGGSASTSSAEKAAEFGYTTSFFNINPELKKLLADATKGNWNSARFVAALQNTHWFRTTQESMRKYQALKSSDPKTLSEQVSALQNHILNLGGQMGAVLSPATAAKMADRAIQLGQDDDALKRILSGMLTTNKGWYTGSAGAFQTQFDQILGDYGVSVSNATVGNWIKQAVLGGQTADSVKDMVQQLAESKYPSLAKRINGGETVRQIADPYIQSYGKLLEVAPDNIKLDDPLIQHALVSKDEKGQPTTQTLYDFENTLRNDPRWSKTQNAQDLMSTTANQILSTMGLH